MVVGGDVVWDLGAGIGYQTVALARRVGASGMVVAAEEDPGRRQDVAANLTLNGVRNVRLVESAARAAGAAGMAGSGSAERPRTVRWRRRKRAASDDAGSTADRPPTLIRMGDGGGAALVIVTDAALAAGPVLFMANAAQVALGALREWASAHGYTWFWFFSAGSPGSAGSAGSPADPTAAPDPRVALVGVPNQQPPPPGLALVTATDTSWREAFTRQDRRFNAAPDRWAFSRHGLDKRWH